jgi:pimeloyl-ACP methyl ester carboxylesterase
MTAMYGYYRVLPQDAQDNQAFLAANGKLRMPVLALGGDKAFGRGIETLESLQRVAENVRGGLIHNSGHWVTEEQPEFVGSELRKFFLEEVQQ